MMVGMETLPADTTLTLAKGHADGALGFAKGHADEALAFAKGHGTGNDFVLLPDPDGTIPLDAALAAALCDRRFGVGGDGVLRVVRTAAHPEAVAHAGEAEWFMDYWNSDGSLADMCGNGVRVFARYLVEHGLAAPERLPIWTRAGLVVARVSPQSVSVAMPVPRVFGTSAVAVAGQRLAGTVAECGNPNLVCRVADASALSTLDLNGSLGLDAAVFPRSANVEFVVVADDTGGTAPGADLQLRLRVVERGSGETLSCGSGACAVAAVALRGDLTGEPPRSAGVVAIDVPGGRLVVALDADSCVLTGPAVLVATGTIALAALARSG
jgi:diaminopimelate epimerase